MVSFALLLSCLSILLFSSQNASSRFSSKVEMARQSLEASSDALAIDSAGSYGKASYLPSSLSTVPREGRLFHLQNPNVSEPLFHKAFSDQGGAYVQTSGLEPV
jgi:hypothetical protein